MLDHQMHPNTQRVQASKLRPVDGSFHVYRFARSISWPQLYRRAGSCQNERPWLDRAWGAMQEQARNQQILSDFRRICLGGGFGGDCSCAGPCRRLGEPLDFSAGYRASVTHCPVPNFMLIQGRPKEETEGPLRIEVVQSRSVFLCRRTWNLEVSVRRSGLLDDI